ncbi:MAG: 4-amino-4-deoxy-L-arabinose transferase-like glycosyltransferase [Myxococcota bacterium]|jgi:4-amino-4-deoxy-L-arabinose transferase-like glycosyltransferase
MARGALITAAVATLFLSVGIGGGSHMDSDDTLYAQIAREMVQSGDWIDTTWGGVVVFEKPPLVFWSLGLAGAAGDWAEGPLRVPGAAFAILGLVALWLLGRRLGLEPGAAWLACGLVCGSWLFLMLTRRLMTDVPMVSCVLIAAAALAHNKTRWFGAMCGLAVLAKGPGAAPPILALVAWGLGTRRLNVRSLAVATGLGLLVAAPWHLAMTARHGTEFWSGYVGYHVGARATSNVVPGLTFGQLLDVVAQERLLLGLALLGLVMLVLRRAARPLDRFVLVWLAIACLPPFLMTTRLPQYLLPLIPALALLAAGAVPTDAWRHRLAPLVAGAVVLAAFFAHADKLSYWLSPDFGPHKKALGQAVAEASAPSDQRVAWNLTSNALTFYGGGERWTMVGADPRFYAIQDTVLAIQRAGVLAQSLPRPIPGARRFVVARAVDVPSVAAALGTGRVLSRVVAGPLVLVNDAGMGQPLSP